MSLDFYSQMDAIDTNYREEVKNTMPGSSLWDIQIKMVSRLLGVKFLFCHLQNRQNEIFRVW